MELIREINDGIHNEYLNLKEIGGLKNENR